MADQRRLQRIASRIRQDVAELLQSDLKDPRMRGLISVTNVDVSTDMTNIRVFYSILGSEADVRTTKRFMEDAETRISRTVASGLHIRVLPKIRLIFDESIAKGLEVSKLIDEAMAADRKADQERNSNKTEEE
ncbi:30S ribosome-binding factor RbfA [Planctomycetota bacterium]|nr:30S ribosome-binding factor RbfA [Planctomycetota bacterium]